MRDYTKIPNPILRESQLTVPARYLYCVLLRYCGNDEWCFPSQQTLADDLGYSARQIRNLLRQLENAGLIFRKRKGFNRSNSYNVAKSLETTRKAVSSNSKVNNKKNRKSNSSHLGSKFPFHEGKVLPPNSTYLKGKDNKSKSQKGIENLRKEMVNLGLKKDTKKVVSSLA